MVESLAMLHCFVSDKPPAPVGLHCSHSLILSVGFFGSFLMLRNESKE